MLTLLGHKTVRSQYINTMTLFRLMGRLASSPGLRRDVNRPWRNRPAASAVLQRDISIGILREDYDKWERRV